MVGEVGLCLEMEGPEVTLSVCVGELPAVVTAVYPTGLPVA